MGNYPVEHSEEIFDMLALEWNLDDALQARFEDGMEQGREQGMEQGREQEREAVAVKLIRMGFQFADIQKATDLSIQHIQRLARNTNSCPNRNRQ